MKKKINKFLFMVLIPVVVCMTAGILAFSGISDAYTSVRALSGNGGIIYVGSGSKLNMTNGSLYGGTATNGGAVYVSANGTFNLSGGLIFANTASTNGNNIYNGGTFTMTGGKVGKQVLARVDENGNKSETGNYVYFGSYPQTLKASSVTIDASSVDGNGYYLGSDGERYAKVTAKKDCYGNSSKYTFSNGSSISAGTTYYFKVEPIKWKILSSSNGKLTLYAEDIIEQSRWDSSVILNYKTSTIRSFINGDFLNGAFSSEEQAMIQATTVDNGTSTVPSAGASCVCENTTDKVFLLSYKDVINGETYGFTNSSRMKQATDFAKANGLYVSVSSVTSENQTMYWTRSPYDNSTYNYATMISTGEVMGGGIEANLGVAPAIVVSNSETDNGYGIYNTGTMNLYGGTVYDDIYSTVSFSTKMGANIAGTMHLADGATITVEDYAGTTPSYTIVIDSTRGTGTILTFKGNSTEPDLSKLNITGFNTDSYKLKTEKDSSGNWTVVLYSYAMSFPKNWKTQVASTTYMTTTVTLANLTSIKFVSSVPSGYTKIGTLSTGLPVYQGTTATEIAFVCEKIYAPVDSSYLFSSLSALTTIDTSVFDTTKVTNMYYMFHYCSSLTSLNLSNFNTSNVTNMYEMFYYCSGLTSLDLSSFNTSNVTNMSGMFYRCTGLSSLDLRNFNTSNVTNMSEMFSMWLSSANKLTNIDVSKFDTSKVTNMSSMFSNCKGLTSLNLSNFDTAKVTVMSRMFEDCSSLTSLNLSNFNTSNVTNMSSMFYNCSSLTSLNLSNFDTAKVSDMSDMFSNCKGLTSLNLSNFNTSNVTNMSNMFFNCKGLTSLDLSNFDTAKVSDMSNMFTICSGLKSINLTGLNTLKVTTMKLMFHQCSSLTSLNLSNFNTSNVTNMSEMFSSCSSLTSLDLSNFDTTKVSNMSNMFHQCSGLTSLDVSNFDTAKVTDMSRMFSLCSSLTSLNLSNFNTLNVTNMSSMFSNCRGLTSLDLSSFDMAKVTNSENMLNFGTSNKIQTLKTPYNNSSAIAITTGSTLYNAETGEVVTSVPANTTKSLTYVNENPIKIFPTTWKTELGSIFNSIYQDDSTVTLIRFEKTVPTGYTSFGTLSTGIKVYQKNYKEIAFVAESTIFSPENSSSLFASVAYTSILFNNFDTSKVTTMNQMFSSCSSLETADISGFNTSKVTDMNAIFSGCHKWTNIDVSNFNTTQVTDMTSMFSGCFAVTSLNVRGFNTSKVTKMAYMFLQCRSLKSLDASNFDTSNVTDMTVMFYECSSLETLDVSGFNMTKVVDSGYFSQVFYFGSSNAIKIFKTPYNNSAALAITTGSSLYVVANGTKYTSVPASTSTSLTLRAAYTISFNYNGGSGSESSRTVLYGLTIGTLPSASQSGYTFNGWYTSSSGGSRFYSSTVVTQIQVLYAHWTENTPTPDPDPDPPTPPDPDPDPGPGPSEDSDIEGAEYIIFTTTKPSGLHSNSDYTYNSRSFFNSDCSTPDVYTNESGTQVAFVASPGDLVAPTDCTGMFKNMMNLKWVIFRNYDTFNSTDFTEMFYGCPALERVDCLSIQTPNVTSMRAMFQECNSLKEIVYANFDCISLTDASYMFAGCSMLGTGSSIGQNYFNETIPVVPELKYTYNLDNAEKMFYGASFGEYFCMPYFTTENLSNASGMFTNFTVDILDLSQFICRNYSAADLFYESSGFNFKAIYTPRFADISFLPTDTWLLGDGSNSDLFGYIGMEDSVAPFSLCFVKEEYKDYYRKGTFQVVINDYGFDELSVIIQKLGEAGIYFSGNSGSFTFTTYLPLNDVYYVLPIPYKDDFDNGNDGEMRFAGWVVSGAKTKEELGFEDFIGYWELGSPQNSYCGGTYPIEAIGWADDTVSRLQLSYNGDMSTPDTPYYNWYENSRNLYSRVRYLPTCRNESGNIFYGWSESSQGAIISYYNNIVSYGGGSDGTVWWSDGLTAEFRDLSMYTGDNDYWTLPSESSSFRANQTAYEKEKQELLKLYNQSKQTVLIPEDKKVTITELKIDKIA